MSLDTPQSRATAPTGVYDGFHPAPRAEAGTPRARRAALSWAWRGLLTMAVVFPLLLLALAGRQSYQLEQRQAEAEVAQTLGEMHEHTQKVFQTYQLILAWIDDRIRGLDWERIAHDEALHQFLVDLQALPQIRSIEIVDPSGRVRASGEAFPALQADVSQRRYFGALQQRDAGVVITRIGGGAAGENPEFAIGRRRSGGPAGGFDGIVSITARTAYFTEFYGTIAPVKDFTAALLRDDGVVLAAYPAPFPPADFAPHSPLMQAIARLPTTGVFRDAERIYGYRRVAGLPLYVVFGLPEAVVLEDWRGNLANYALLAVPAAFALFLLVLFATRQMQQERIATWRWRTTAQRLRRESERRSQVEAELRQAQKMEALGQLTGGVAHDFNNLLTVLQGNLELMRGRQRDAGLETKLDQALQTVDRAGKLTAQLLAFARRQPLHTESVDVNRLLRGMDDLIARTVGGRISIAMDPAADLWPATSDATQLELAVMNLAINARDAMPEGGTLRIRTFNARLSATQTGDVPRDFVALQITDTGTGMPPEVRAKAFEPFFTTKEPGKGTGLGLSMVYGFVRQTGGIATLDSEPGRGTTVTLHLPRAVAEEAAATGLPADRRT